MLRIENLTKYYGEILGVKDVNLEVNEGEIFGFIGPNGAGKSTTIRLIIDLLKPDSGKVLINGENTFHNYDIKKDIGYLASEVNLYPEMKVSEVLDLNKAFYEKDITKKTNLLVKKLKLDTSKIVEELSFGNLKKLGIVLALAHDPKLIILDEPTSGLDPIMQETFFDILKDEQKKGSTIFFSSHILSEVKKICDRIAIIKDGTIIKVEEIGNLTKQEFNFITVYSKEHKSLKIPVKDIVIVDESDDYVKFIFKKDINKLLKYLSDIKMDKLLIEEPAIEEVFMHYYK